MTGYKKILFLCIVSILIFFSCTTGKSWDFNTDYFSIVVNDKGYIISMKNITVLPNREFSPTEKPSPLIS